MKLEHGRTEVKKNSYCKRSDCTSLSAFQDAGLMLLSSEFRVMQRIMPKLFPAEEPKSWPSISFEVRRNAVLTH